MSDPLYELIYDIQHNGLRWMTIITLYALFRKERRNYYLDRRDEAVFQNQKIIMEKLGVGECFVENPNSKKNLEQTLLRRGQIIISPAHIAMLFTRRKVTEKSISGRKKKMKSKLLSRKLWMAIFGALLPIVNEQFNLGLDTNTVIASVGAIVAYILGQAHVDAKTVQNASTPAQSNPNKFIQG